ncbi:MAG: DUF5107 domain-containing protein [Acidobacteriota bacterium]
MNSSSTTNRQFPGAWSLLPILALFCGALLARQAGETPKSARPVTFTRGVLEVPTYTFGRSETVAPLFPSQASSGLYPYAALDRDSLSRRPVPVKYESLTLENESVRVVLLPELGGRIWSARDKTAGREIFYYTSVIKPTGYNQRSGWPAGNLEVYGPYDAHMLTWPGEPWPWALSRNSDGSATVVVSHIDHFFRNKVSMAVKLYPGRSFVELTIQLRNNNPLPNRYLLWTNAGIPATAGTRFVYPMTRTIAHDSSELGTWPLARGVDLSWYKNNQNMLGVFGLDLHDHFIAAYDYQSDYGTVCYANRLLARGVKTWTWGTGAAAMRQMATYTDTAVPYIEVQSGRFVWDGNYEFIDPGRSDGWTEYWYGAGGLGGLTTANRDTAIFFDAPAGHRGTATLAVKATGDFPEATFELKADGNTIWRAQHPLAVGGVYRAKIQLMPEAADKVLRLTIRSAGELLVDRSFHPDGSHPDSVLATDSIPRKYGPVETLAAEEVYQKGVAHEKFGQLEQARQAYQAALSKDGQFTAPHLRLGLMALEDMQHEPAIEHFVKVLARDPTHNDAHYFLAVAYGELGNDTQAKRHYSRLLPSSGKFDQRDYGLGLLALRTGDLEEARVWLSRAVAATPTQLPLRQAYAVLLRRLGRAAEARKEGEAILQLDPTNALAQAEKIFLADSSGAATRDWTTLDRACARHAQGYLELATEYFKLSAWKEARRVVERGIDVATAAGQTPYPLLHYYRAYAADRSGDQATTRQALAAARAQLLSIEIFPFRRETITVLTRALAIEPQDANAASLLGEILYSRSRRQEAQAAWRLALRSDPNHFLALRDLGMAVLQSGQTEEALVLLARASEQRPDHLATTILVARLQARAGHADVARQVLERALVLQPRNDHLMENLAWVEAQSGRYQRAIELLTEHTFEPRHQSYSLLHLYQAARLMAALESAKKGMHAAAIDHVRAGQRPPVSLGVDDFATLQSARLLVFEAVLHQAAGASAAALRLWKTAAETGTGGNREEELFAAVAQDKVGQNAAAEERLRPYMNAVEGEDKENNPAETRALAHYLSGIYAAFRGQPDQARASFRRSLEIDPSLLWAQQALAWLEAGLLTKVVSR